MTDYASHKVSELADLLKERGLPHSGKKADLISRLQAHDAEQSSSTGAADSSTPAATSDPKPASEVLTAAGGKGQPSNPTAVPTQAVGEDMTASDKGLEIKQNDGEATAATAAGSAQAEPQEPAKDFTAGIKTLTLEEEMERRKKRAERFGPIKKTEPTSKDAAGESNTSADVAAAAPTDADSIKAAEEKLLARQKRFGGVVEGADVAGVDSLNSALAEPEKRDRHGRKRGRDAGSKDGAKDGEPKGKRVDSRRRDGRGEGQGQGQKNGKPAASGAAKPAGGAKPAASASAKPTVSAEQREKDRLAAEKRKARFSKAAAT